MAHTHRTVVSLLASLALLGSASSVFACGGEGKHEKEDKSPSALCGGEGKHEKEDKSPSSLCGGEGKHEKEDKSPSTF